MLNLITKSNFASINIFRHLALMIIVLFLITGLFAMPYADEFTFLTMFQHLGFLPAIKTLYLDWSGRFASNIILGLSVKSLFYHFWLVPTLLILLSIGSIAALLKALFQQSANIACCHSAAIILGFYLLIAPIPWNIHHSLRIFYEQFFWIAGGITYQVGICLLLLLLASIRYFYLYPTKRHLCLSATLCLFAIGMNETLMVGIVCIMFLIAMLFYQKKFRIFWTVILLITILSSLIVLISPGNTIRETHFIFKHQIGLTLIQSIQHGTIRFLAYLLNPLFWIYCILCRKPYAFLAQCLSEYLPHATLQGLLLYLFVCILFVPAAWAMGANLPPRGMGLVSFLTFLTLPIVIFSILQQYANHHFIQSLSNILYEKKSQAFYRIAALMILGLNIIFMPSLLASIQASAQGYAFKQQVLTCHLQDKSRASARCKNTDEYAALRLLGYPNNIKDNYEFGN